MAGNKNSGRRIASVTEKRKKIIDKAWDIIEEQLDDPNIPRRDKLNLARDLVVKSIPQEIDGADLTIQNYVQIYRPESYSREEVEAESRATDRSI